MKFLLIEDIKASDEIKTFCSTLTEKMGKEFLTINASKDIQDFQNFQDSQDFQDVDLLFIACLNQRRTIQRWLNRTRDLRIPYMFLTDTMAVSNIQTILLPVTLLEEEVYKTQFAAHIARYTGAKVVLFLANDYGSKALQNCNKMKTLLDKMEVKNEVVKARKDSFNLYKELSTPVAATDKGEILTINHQLSVLTASREYGLDDILFGPQERHVICKSAVPAMLLNPREDLFALCD